MKYETKRRIMRKVENKRVEMKLVEILSTSPNGEVKFSKQIILSKEGFLKLVNKIKECDVEFTIKTTPDKIILDLLTKDKQRFDSEIELAMKSVSEKYIQ
jgi:hypothetical protein